MVDGPKRPGWDATLISKVTKAFFGDLRGFFEAHNWPERGQKMMTKVQSHVPRTYGSFENFKQHFDDKSEHGSIHKQILRENPNVILSEMDWQPEVWGCDWYNSEEEANRFLRLTEPGVISLAIQDDRLVGAYQLTHLAGDISDFSADKSETNYAFKAYRAWTFKEPPLVSDVLENSWGDYQNDDQHEMVKVRKEEALNLLKLSWDTTSLHGSNPFENDPSVWITSFWGWSPETWGCVGFTNEARPYNIIKKTSDPFLMLIYVTETAPGNTQFKGKVVGYYELSHEVGLKEEFISENQMNAAHHPKEKWAHSFRALRAWDIDDDFKPSIREFHPDLVKNKQQQTVSTWAKPLPSEQIAILKSLPAKEVQVYKGPKVSNSVASFPIGSGRVGGGNFRGSGYEVGEPTSTEKQLYILELSGAAHDFVNEVTEGQKIYKVGLSAWPAGRKIALNSAIPNGKFSWGIRNSNEKENQPPYSTFKVAKAGEDRMKDFLAAKHRDPADTTRHLGGEFYLTDEKSIGLAWSFGRDTAIESEGKTNG